MTVQSLTALKTQLTGYKTLLEIEPYKITNLIDTLEAVFGATYVPGTDRSLISQITNGGAGSDILSVTDVLLTAAAQTTLYTVPTGKTLFITGIQVVGKAVSVTAGRTSTLKVGTTAGSYAELLNGATGMVQAVDTATSILANGAILDGLSFYVPANVAASRVSKFVADTILKADVSTAGTLPTAGTVTVILRGYLV